MSQIPADNVPRSAVGGERGRIVRVGETGGDRISGRVIDIRASDETEGGYTVRDLAILAGLQTALLLGLTTAIAWWAYPVLWLLPVYLFMYLGDNFPSFAEHPHPKNDAASDEHRLITYLSNPLERWFLAPMNMNYHAAHHLWPSIPYYNLPIADREIRGLPDAAGLECAGRTSCTSLASGWHSRLRSVAPERRPRGERRRASRSLGRCLAKTQGLIPGVLLGPRLALPQHATLTLGAELPSDTSAINLPVSASNSVPNSRLVASPSWIYTCRHVSTKRREAQPCVRAACA